ncbi:hypothetical protein PHPALM_30072 [Phytophthora palmivora]|uniref:Uncharacterized protein n=1 Tax=Phytophthora palmivora TaxID=4796 RepID=A0A2P4X610_9STRA|nr:hypothetical protein PHPALM_30072 [Phytophthora palmivora]
MKKVETMFGERAGLVEAENAHLATKGDTLDVEKTPCFSSRCEAFTCSTVMTTGKGGLTTAESMKTEVKNVAY